MAQLQMSFGPAVDRPLSSMPIIATRQHQLRDDKRYVSLGFAK